MGRGLVTDHELCREPCPTALDYCAAYGCELGARARRRRSSLPSRGTVPSALPEGVTVGAQRGGRCPDCGEYGERAGHQECAYPGDHDDGPEDQYVGGYGD